MASSENRAPQPSGQLSFHAFQRLPSDLQARIVTMACWLPKPPGWPQEYGTAVVRLDVDTARSLALVCAPFHAIVARCLYEHIRIGRPSTLRMLLDSIVRRPALGRLIKSLHIGPEDGLSYDWLPFGGGGLTLSVTAPSDAGREPRWSCAPPSHPVCLRSSEGSGPPHAMETLEVAIKTASRSLDVDTSRTGIDFAGRVIDIDTWYCRGFELFAAIELYAIEMARCEGRNRANYWTDRDTRYTRLVITGGPGSPGLSPPSASEEEVFALSRAQLLNRLANPKGKTDRFDHPLLFARSGIAWEARQHGYAVIHGGTEPQWREGDAEDPLDAQRTDGNPLLDVALPSTATVGDILNLTRALLAQTPLLQNLSLSGFLERAICGARGPMELKALRFLSLGPPPTYISSPGWYPPLRFETPPFPNVERLRICGHSLDKQQAVAIGGGSVLKKLQYLQWNFARKIPREGLLDTISVLAACDLASSDSSPGILGRKRGRESEEEADSPPDPRPFIEARLHPLNVAQVIDAAPTPAIGRAWRNGDPWPVHSSSQRRLKVIETPAYDDSGHATWAEIKELREMHDEGRKWFEEGVKAVGVCE